MNTIKNSIEILYKKYINSDDSGISTIHMLQIIENKIKNLLNSIENLNPELILEAEKVIHTKISSIHLIIKSFIVSRKYCSNICTREKTSRRKIIE